MPNTPPSSPDNTQKNDVPPSANPTPSYYAGGLFGKMTIPTDTTSIRPHQNHLHITRPCDGHPDGLEWVVYEDRMETAKSQMEGILYLLTLQTILNPDPLLTIMVNQSGANESKEEIETPPDSPTL